MINWRRVASAVLMMAAGSMPAFGQLPDLIPARHVAQSDSSAMTRLISVNLQRVPLTAAIDTIAARGHVHIAYSPAGVSDKMVSLVADSIRVGDALAVLLRDTGISVAVSRTGWLMLRRPDSAPVAAGAIAGVVLDSATRLPVPYALLRIEETGQRAQVGPQGRYLLAAVTPGQYRVTARRVGYTAATRSVTVVDGETATLDFTLGRTATKLDEVVTTAVGDQRRYQIGNDIGSINVDSLTLTAPVTSLTDVISARVPGVEVLESDGEVGNGPSLRVRGQGSLVLQGDPIVIVDGVRQANTPGSTEAPLFASGNVYGAVPAPSRLNDIDFNDVASIDILRGPSAATEYGTDAANGVIVIKTKHSQAGAPRWSLSAEQASSQVGTRFPNTYYAFGHTTGASPQATQCPMVPGYQVSVGWATGTCAVDSLVKFNPLDHASTTIFGTGTREKLNLSVAGGSDAVRYYVTGGLTNETGTLQLPNVFKPIADSIGLPRSDWRPNTDDQRSARANTVIRLTTTADLQVNASYMATDQRAPESPSLYDGTYAYAITDNAAKEYGYGAPTLTPVYNYGNLVGQNTDRLTGSLAASWAPASWLSAHATAGVDHGSQRATAEILPQIVPLAFGVPASLGITNGTTDIYSFDGRAVATARLTSSLRAITSAGLQLVDTRTQATYAQSTSITSTNPTLNGATNALITQTGIRQATLGGYIEEQLGLWDRLFVTGAARVDAGSNFGSGYNSAVYPKASLSWLALTGGTTTVRLRGAFGESGIQPPNGAALELYGQQAAYLNGTATTTPGIVNVVNANLQPERSREFEGGVDFGLWGDRATVGLTAYAKTTTNALVATGTGWEAGNLNAYENVGEVTNNGFEANVSATLIRSRRATWDVSLGASTNHNNLVKFAPGLQPQEIYGYASVMRFAPGTPLYSYAAGKEHWTNQYHGGIVESGDVSVEDSLSYVGPSQPTRMASFSTHVGLWRGLFTVGALLDYRGGFRLMNTTAMYSGTFAQSDQASNDGHAPAWEQRRDVATALVFHDGLDNYGPSSGFYEDASYVRFRELALTVALPDHLARVAHLRTLSLVGAIRNLALWTPFTGGDPEVTSSAGQNALFSPTTNTVSVSHDLRESFAPVPLSRYFVLRLNAGF